MRTKNMSHDAHNLKYFPISLDILKTVITFTNIGGYKRWDSFSSKTGIKITQSTFALFYEVIFPFKKEFCEHKQGNII